MTHWIKRENPRCDHGNRKMERGGSQRENGMECESGVTCDWVELMMEPMDVFVQIDWSPDVVHSVIPIIEGIQQSEIDENLNQESSKMKLRMMTVHLGVMQIPCCLINGTRPERRYAEHERFDCFEHSLVPILFILFLGRWFENGSLGATFDDCCDQNGDHIQLDVIVQAFCTKLGGEHR